MITEEIIDQFKKRMRIYHESEDDSIKQMLESSFIVVKNLCGEFEIKDNAEGKELVFERTRYLYNDNVEFFEQNFLSRIHAFGYTLRFDAEEVNDDDKVSTTTYYSW